jgi:hypothetical protein
LVTGSSNSRTARVLLISGSTRGGSTNTALLRTAAAALPGTFKNLLDRTVGGPEMYG